MTEGKTKLRMTVLAALVAFMFAALSTRLWFLQVLATEEFAQQATTNRVRIIPEPAPRGRILDRKGQVLVKNRATTVLTVDRSKLQGDEREKVLFRLAELLNQPVEDLAERLEDRRYYAYQPVPVAFDVPEAVALYVGEHDDEMFPGVEVEDDWAVRDYPAGKMAAHTLGYVGEVSAEELEQKAFDGYRQGTIVGKAGVERVYEPFLQGEEGLSKFEVNSLGDIEKHLGGNAPVPGADLVLAIDKKIQSATDRSLRLGIDLARDGDEAGGGAAVVMDPRNGQVLAMSSFPGFDPSAFVSGITSKELRRLSSPKANFPLINRVIQSAYPPGSTFKPFVAAAAVREGWASRTSSHECPPQFQVPGDESTVFNNWKSTHSGYISLAQSLIESCDTVYYRFGLNFYRLRSGARGEVFQKHLRTFGFGRRSGIDLPNETPGRIPTLQWKREAAKTNKFLVDYWLPGDDINMSIGQGNVQVSPLQLAVAYSAIANGGTLWEPRMALRAQRSDGDVVRKFGSKKAGRVPYSKETLGYITEGLVGVTRSGTGAFSFAGFPLDRIPVAGKTGTAEMQPREDFSWFAAFAPAYDPKYVVVAMVEEGGHGSETAAPIVRRVFEGIFGLGPTEELQEGPAVD